MSTYLNALMNRVPNISDVKGREYYYAKVERMSNTECQAMLRQVEFLEQNQKDSDSYMESLRKTKQYGKRKSYNLNTYSQNGSDPQVHLAKRLEKLSATKGLSPRAKTLIGYEFNTTFSNDLKVHTIKTLPDHLLVSWEGFTSKTTSSYLMNGLLARTNLTGSLVKHVIMKQGHYYDSIVLAESIISRDVKNLELKIATYMMVKEKLEQTDIEEKYRKRHIETLYDSIKNVLVKYRKENGLEHIPESWVLDIAYASQSG